MQEAADLHQLICTNGGMALERQVSLPIVRRSRPERIFARLGYLADERARIGPLLEERL